MQLMELFELVREQLKQDMIFNVTSLFEDFEIQRYFENDAQLSSKNKPRFNGVYSRHNLPAVKTCATKVKDGAYVTNVDEYKSLRTHLIALYVYSNNATYFDSFGVEYISKEIKKFIGSKHITKIFYKIQECDSVIFE